ncbi:MAG: 4Fe-4S single cluster domain-containing protein, partial [Evtepia sp.]
HNPDTHDPFGGREVSLSEFSAPLSNPLLSGLTLSGGEPFLQAAECAKLAALAHEKHLNVWVYSGYTYEFLSSQHKPDWDQLLAETDVLVDGAFIDAQKSYDLEFRGSANQRLIDIPASQTSGKLVLWSRPNPLAKFTVPES